MIARKAAKPQRKHPGLSLRLGAFARGIVFRAYSGDGRKRAVPRGRNVGDFTFAGSPRRGRASLSFAGLKLSLTLSWLGKSPKIPAEERIGNADTD
jgi:hypothetical protein